MASIFSKIFSYRKHLENIRRTLNKKIQKLKLSDFRNKKRMGALNQETIDNWLDFIPGRIMECIRNEGDRINY